MFLIVSLIVCRPVSSRFLFSSFQGCSRHASSPCCVLSDLCLAHGPLHTRVMELLFCGKNDGVGSVHIYLLTSSHEMFGTTDTRAMKYVRRSTTDRARPRYLQVCVCVCVREGGMKHAGLLSSWIFVFCVLRAFFFFLYQSLCFIFGLW